jgi:ferredoxin
MRINPGKCVACGNCTYVCPMGAIYIDPVLKRATIDRDECVECYTCFNGLSQEHLPPGLVRTVRRVFGALRIRFEPEPDVCPTAAFEPDELTWPRVVRRAFSDPRVPHESTGVEGRGTEEVKTNDVTGRVGPGEVGFTIELGRPGVGVRFRDIQEVCRALASAGVAFEQKNPVTSLMSDVATGTIRDDILDEKVLSAIVEIKVPVARAEEIVRLVWDVEQRIDTVVSIGAGVRCDERGEDTVVAPIFERLGYELARAKTNIGLGRRGASTTASANASASATAPADKSAEKPERAVVNT